MLTYQKCKELKDAGFPQGKSEHVWGIGQGYGARLQAPRWSENAGELMHPIDSPTLSELIEECEEVAFDGFQALTTDGYGWDAKSNLGKKGSGSTPEEALVKLWLALRK